MTRASRAKAAIPTHTQISQLYSDVARLLRKDIGTSVVMVMLPVLTVT